MWLLTRMFMKQQDYLHNQHLHTCFKSHNSIYKRDTCCYRAFVHDEAVKGAGVGQKLALHSQPTARKHKHILVLLTIGPVHFLLSPRGEFCRLAST